MSLPSVYLSKTLSALNATLQGGPFPFGVVLVQIGGSGWTATAQIQVSLDNGTTWSPASSDGAGTPVAISAPVTVEVPIQLDGMYVGIALTAYTSGNVDCVLAWKTPSDPVRITG